MCFSSSIPLDNRTLHLLHIKSAGSQTYGAAYVTLAHALPLADRVMINRKLGMLSGQYMIDRRPILRLI